MKRDLRDCCAKEIVDLFPAFHRKLFHPPPRGVPVAQLRLLGILTHHGTLPMTGIGKNLCMSKPYVTALVDSLLENGLVMRQPDPKDRRIVRISITEEGRKYFRQALALFQDNIRENLKDVPESDLDKLCTALASARKIIEKIP